MKLALNTLMWHDEPFEAVAGYAAQLGLPRLDVGALPAGVGHLRLPAGDHLADACAGLVGAAPEGTRFVAVTADHQGLSASDEEERLAGVGYTIEAMAAARHLGAGVVGTSLGSVGPDRTWSEAALQAATSLRELSARAPGAVRLAIEIHVDDVCDSLTKAEHLLAEAGSERVGVAFDSSLLFHHGIDIGDALERLGDRLFHVHLRGATDETYFAIPGRDRIDFARFLACLEDAHYEGALSLELYEVTPRYGITTLEAAREAMAYLEGFMGGLP